MNGTVNSSYRPRLSARRQALIVQACHRQMRDFRRLAALRTTPGARDYNLRLAREYAEIAALLTDRQPGNPHWETQ